MNGVFLYAKFSFKLFKNISGTNPLPNTTLLANTTYYTTQTVGRCTNTTILSVAITTLVNQGFDWSTLSYYPNPVADLLNLSYSQDIVSI